MDEKYSLKPTYGNLRKDSSYHKLSWNIHGLYENLDEILGVLKGRSMEIPENHKKEKRKVSKWIHEVEYFRDRVNYLMKEKMVEIEKEISHKFETPELFPLAFIQPSTSNLFREIEIYFGNNNTSKIRPGVLSDLYNLGEAEKVLAFIGDAAIDIVLVQILWEPNISRVGELSLKKAELASNRNMARLCDKWDLYDNRIHLDPPTALESKEDAINHVKGTIVEAIYGIIYLEAGIDGVQVGAIHLK